MKTQQEKPAKKLQEIPYLKLTQAPQNAGWETTFFCQGLFSVSMLVLGRVVL